MSIIELFPTPILYEYESGYKFTEEELGCLSQYSTVKPGLNHLSNNSRVLENDCMKNIKSFLEDKLYDYTKNILKIEQNFYITQTWFTKNFPGESHGEHVHNNSIVSGVLYASAELNGGKLIFYNDNHNNSITKQYPFEYSYSQCNSYNIKKCWFEVKTGTLILFPSWLKHSVSVNESDKIRYCIGFNSFVRGEFGSSQTYSDLILL